MCLIKLLIATMDVSLHFCARNVNECKLSHFFKAAHICGTMRSVVSSTLRVKSFTLHFSIHSSSSIFLRLFEFFFVHKKIPFLDYAISHISKKKTQKSCFVSVIDCLKTLRQWKWILFDSNVISFNVIKPKYLCHGKKTTFKLFFQT